LSWHFKDSIVEREKEFFSKRQQNYFSVARNSNKVEERQK
jgi:hypothetical protein